MRNLQAKVPRSAQPMVASLVRTIFAQERSEDAWRQLGEVVAKLTDAELADDAELLSADAPDVLAYTAFPKDVWRKTWSNNRRNDSTAKSVAAPTSWGSSPTGLR